MKKTINRYLIVSDNWKKELENIGFGFNKPLTKFSSNQYLIEKKYKRKLDESGIPFIK